jgi:hypothetical protein
MTQSEPPKGHWIILGVAVIIGSAAVLVGSTLEAPQARMTKGSSSLLVLACRLLSFF